MKSILIAFMTYACGLITVTQTGTLEKRHEERSTNLSCYSCSTIDDWRCRTINETARQTSLHESVRQCEPKHHYCSVLLLETKFESKPDYKFWAVERKCVESCVDGCFILGERTKLRLCTSCCDQMNCNYGDMGSKTCQINKFLFFCLMFCLLFVNISALHN